MRNSKVQSKNVRYEPANYGIASNTGIDNYSSYMERSKTQILMAAGRDPIPHKPVLKTQAAWNVFQDESTDGATERS
jgi:hypothetical protein